MTRLLGRWFSSGRYHARKSLSRVIPWVTPPEEAFLALWYFERWRRWSEAGNYVRGRLESVRREIENGRLDETRVASALHSLERALDPSTNPRLRGQ